MRAKEKKNYILIIILLCLTIFLFILFSSLIKLLKIKNNDVNDRNDSYTDSELNTAFEEKGKYPVSIINPEYLQLTGAEAKGIDIVIDKIIDCLNNKKTQELYDELLESYKMLKFKTLEEFESFLKNKFPNTDYQCVSYDLEALNAFVRIKSLNDENDTHEIKIYSEDFSDETKTKIVLENFNYTQNTGGTVYLGDAIIKMKSFVFYGDKASIYVEIYNTSNKKMELEFYESKVWKKMAGAKKEIISKIISDIEIPPKEFGYVEIFFDDVNMFKIEPEHANFKLNMNGEEEEIDVFFMYEDPSI